MIFKINYSLLNATISSIIKNWSETFGVPGFNLRCPKNLDKLNTWYSNADSVTANNFCIK